TGHFQTRVLQLKDGLLTAGTGALDANFDLEHPAALGGLSGSFSSPTCGPGRALARAFNAANRPSRRPRNRLAIGVGDRHDRVVEGALDVSDAARNALADLLLRAGF